MGKDLNLVYILSEYEEQGAEKVTATLDKSRLVDMLEENWPLEKEYAFQRQVSKEEHEEWIVPYREALKELMQKPDEELISGAGQNLCEGWGGLMLHVVRLV